MIARRAGCAPGESAYATCGHTGAYVRGSYVP